jgi:hypothetical protein
MASIGSSASPLTKPMPVTAEIAGKMSDTEAARIRKLVGRFRERGPGGLRGAMSEVTAERDGARAGELHGGRAVTRPKPDCA